jgi:hypothetical protein
MSDSVGERQGAGALAAISGEERERMSLGKVGRKGVLPKIPLICAWNTLIPTLIL